MSWLSDLLNSRFETTLGEIIILAAAATSIILGIGVLLKMWVVRHPFKMIYFEKPWNTEEDINPKCDWKIVECAADEQVIVFVGLTLRTQRNFETIDVRFMERQWLLFWKEGPKEHVKVIRFMDPQFGFRFSRSEDNKKGGQEGNYRGPINCPKGDVMWYVVTVVSNIDWNGYLSFQLRRGSSHRGIGRLPFCFKIDNIRQETNS